MPVEAYPQLLQAYLVDPFVVHIFVSHFASSNHLGAVPLVSVLVVQDGLALSWFLKALVHSACF
jgi:hypothetical protein